MSKLNYNEPRDYVIGNVLIVILSILLLNAFYKFVEEFVFKVALILAEKL